MFAKSGSEIDEDAPSTGTERVDCISKCHSGVWDAITFSKKTAVLEILALRGDA